MGISINGGEGGRGEGGRGGKGRKRKKGGRGEKWGQGGEGKRRKKGKRARELEGMWGPHKSIWVEILVQFGFEILISVLLGTVSKSPAKTAMKCIEITLAIADSRYCRHLLYILRPVVSKMFLIFHFKCQMILG